MAHEPRLGYQKRWNGRAGSQMSMTTEVIDYLDNQRGNPNLSGWPTPREADSKAGPDYQTKNRDAGGMSLPTISAMMAPARLTSTGQVLTGCFAGMESGGQLDPDHSRWLMRLPVALVSCMPSETASTLRKQPPPASPSWKETWC
ncbi:MAG: hypothetical protein ABJL72_11570 [Roseobacter sp.]